jgi:hypothetical protein
MLIELYIEALLADKALADEVWHLWDAGEITDDMAAWAWAWAWAWSMVPDVSIQSAPPKLKLLSDSMPASALFTRQTHIEAH